MRFDFMVAGLVAFLALAPARADPETSPAELLNRAAAAFEFDLASSRLAVELGTEQVQSFANLLLIDKEKATNELTYLTQDEGLAVTAELTPEASEQLAELMLLTDAAFDERYVALQLEAQEAWHATLTAYSAAHDDEAPVTLFAEMQQVITEGHLQLLRRLASE